jgi:deoxycytidine triphosphate deaminase
MSLLRDEELIAAITAQPPAARYVEGIALPVDPADRYSKDSPVQASSIDLHIGNVYLPGEKQTNLGGAQNPKQDHSLRTGETAVVTTMETLHLPNNIAGFGFPPSRVSFKGLLMTNPGHVDPGYQGVMRFTVINMAEDPYPLERGGKIVTLLLFRLDHAVHADWQQRNPDGSRLPNHAEISRLSRDFVDVENRAKKQGAKVTALIAGALAVVAVILQAVTSGHLFYRDDVEDLKKRQEIVEYDLKNKVDVERKLLDFDSRLKELERPNKSAGSSQKEAVVKPTPKVVGNP